MGSDRSAFRTQRTSIRSFRLAPADYEFTNHSPGQDIAVLALDQPIVNEAFIPHPRFIAGAGKAGFAGYSDFNRDGSTNWTNEWNRTGVALASLSGFGYGPDDNNGGWHYFLQSTSTGFHKGDSGGPLFLVDPDGSRQVIGVIVRSACLSVLSCNSDTEADRFYFAAVTTDTFASQWVNAVALESAHPDIIQRTKNWYLKHQRDATTTWLGEVDYTGPCQPNRDRDCDHWFDEHDNCLAIYNVDQNDSVDDGVGDACRVVPSDFSIVPSRSALSLVRGGEGDASSAPVAFVTATTSGPPSQLTVSFPDLPAGISLYSAQTPWQFAHCGGTSCSISVMSGDTIYVSYESLGNAGPAAPTATTSMSVVATNGTNTHSFPLSLTTNPCVPQSQAEACAGKQCGVATDGCWVRLDCGGCDRFSSCQDNQCVGRLNCPPGWVQCDDTSCAPAANQCTIQFP